MAAAGQLETAKGRLLPLLPPADPSIASETALVTALSQHCLAEAQYLTTLRAIAKGTSPTLIASLAAEAASLYAASGAALTQAGAPAPKLGQYAEYREGTLRALSLGFTALVQWRSPAGAGGARPTAKEALRLWGAAKAAATAYDAAEPRTLNLDHRRADEVLCRCAVPDPCVHAHVWWVGGWEPPPDPSQDVDAVQTCPPASQNAPPPLAPRTRSSRASWRTPRAGCPRAAWRGRWARCRPCSPCPAGSVWWRRLPTVCPHRT